MSPMPSLRRDLGLALLTVGLGVTAPALAGTLVDAGGTSISVAAPQRIVTLGSSTTETVLALGHGDHLVAADASSRGIEGVGAKATLGYYRAVGAEGVLSVRQDLVVGTEAAGPPAALAQVRGAGVPLALLSDAPTLAAATGRITSLGALLDAEAKAAELVASIERDVAEARALRPAEPVRVLFLLSHGGGAGQVAGTDTIADAMIGLAGGVNAFASQQGYTALTPEAVLTARPDVVLLTSGGMASLGGEAAVWAIPGLAQLSRDSVRMVVLDDHLLLGFGPRTGEAALTLARALYPSSPTASAP